MSRIITAAEHLLKLADDLEKEASEKTIFACGGCGHTASLGEINDSIRKHASKVASEGGTYDVSKALVTVNDRVKCAACKESLMSYVATPESEKYYVATEDPKGDEGSDGADDPDGSMEAQSSLEAQAGMLDKVMSGLKNIANIANGGTNVGSEIKEKALEAAKVLDEHAVRSRDMEQAQAMLKDVNPHDLEFIFESHLPPETLSGKLREFKGKYGDARHNTLQALVSIMFPEPEMEHLSSTPIKATLAALLLAMGASFASQGKNVSILEKYLPGATKAIEVVNEMASRPLEKMPAYEQTVHNEDGSTSKIHVPGEGEVGAPTDVAQLQKSARVNQAKLASYLS